MTNQILFDQIAQVLQLDPQVISAYVLGSYVKGQNRPGSDFDLAVIVKRKHEHSDAQIYQLIKDLNFPQNLDLSVVDNTGSPLFLFQIISTGKRVYQASPIESAKFEAFVLHHYYDTAHIRNIYYSYLQQKFPSEYAS